MQLPLSLIRSFLDIDLPPQEIALALTSLGIEVDQIINELPPFSGVVTAEVISAVPHPNADSLQLTEVFDGEQRWQVVCGAPNCRVGMKTVFARVGAVLNQSDAKPFHISKRAIRGVESHGMLCSFSELTIPAMAHEAGIVELPAETQLGVDASSLFWNPIFVISLTPNLGHCLSGLGIARELSAFLKLPLKKNHPIVSEKESEKFNLEIRHPELCPHYAYRIIDQVEVAPSPLWLQIELYAAGIQPISNIVDVTNYILLKYGQPLHAFDQDQIEGSSLFVELSKENQPFHGLDGVERKLPAGILLIADEKKALAIGGILGGMESAVTSKTKKILLEAAHFDPMTIRKGMKKTGIRTESSHRFEKGVDPAGITRALDAAAELIQKLSPRASVGMQMNSNSKTTPRRKILLRIPQVERILGISLSISEITEIFKRLDMLVSSVEEQVLLVEAPTYRFDLEQEVDLIEEIGRIYGYNHIPKKSPLYTSTHVPHDPLYLFQKKIREILIGQGLQEFISSTLISPSLMHLFKEGIQDRSLLKTVHAKTEEYSILRPSLLPSLLQIAAHNIRYRTMTIHGFEIGNIHFIQNQEIQEIPTLGIILSGQKNLPHFTDQGKSVDFFDLKGMIENLFFQSSLSKASYQLSHHPSFQPNHQGEILHENQVVGSLGKVHPSIGAKLGLEEPLFFAEINLQALLSMQNQKRHMTPLPQFPGSERDWTVSVHNHFSFAKLQKAIEASRPPLLAKWELLDLYRPDNSQEKNLTLRFIYREATRTISHDEVEKAHTALIDHLQSSIQCL